MSGVISQALKRLREKTGHSVRDVARGLGWKTTTYQYYEDKYKKAFLPEDKRDEIVAYYVNNGWTEDAVMHALAARSEPSSQKHKKATDDSSAPTLDEALLLYSVETVIGHMKALGFESPSLTAQIVLAVYTDLQRQGFDGIEKSEPSALGAQAFLKALSEKRSRDKA